MMRTRVQPRRPGFSGFGRAGLTMAMLVLMVGAYVYAQPTVTGAPGSDTPRMALDVGQGTLPSLVTLFQWSPVVNSLIALLSVFSVTLFIYYLITMNVNYLAPPAFVDDVTKMVLSGRYDEVAAHCRANRRLFVATIIQRCAENAGKEHSVIMEMIDNEGRRRGDILWNRLSYLADMANLAPMLGLFGTVVGMIQAFFVLPMQAGNISSRLLSESIGGAMSTTMFGLAVAMITLLFYSIIKTRVTNALATTEQIVHSITDHIKRGGA